MRIAVSSTTDQPYKLAAALASTMSPVDGSMMSCTAEWSWNSARWRSSLARSAASN